MGTWRGEGTRGTCRLTFFGEEDDVAIAVGLYGVLLSSARRLARQYYGSNWTPMHRNFMEGFGVAIMQRAKAAKVQGLSPEEGQCYALVCVNKQNWLTQQVSTLGLIPDKPKFAGEFNGMAYVIGMAEGNRADMEFKHRLTAQEA
jgi:hypothetical protein